MFIGSSTCSADYGGIILISNCLLVFSMPPLEASISACNTNRQLIWRCGKEKWIDFSLRQVISDDDFMRALTNCLRTNFSLKTLRRKEDAPLQPILRILLRKIVSCSVCWQIVSKFFPFLMRILERLSRIKKRNSPALGFSCARNYFLTVNPSAHLF